MEHVENNRPSHYRDGIARVSEIVSSLHPFVGTEAETRFHSWLASKNISVDEYMRVASEAWTDIHAWIEAFINWNQFESEWIRWIEFGVNFLRDYNVTPVSCEVYTSTDTYQWTIDLIAIIDEEKWIIDWKSWWIAQVILGTHSEKWKWRKPYDKLKKAEIQLSMYAYATWIENIAVVELALDWYHFHKLKKVNKKRIDDAVSEFYKHNTHEYVSI